MTATATPQSATKQLVDYWTDGGVAVIGVE